MSTFVKEFPFELSQDELRERSQNLANGVQEIESLKETRKIEIKQHNAGILEVQHEVDRLAKVVATGVEFREVECEWQRCFENATMQLIRLDTSEITESRPMDQDERQMNLETGEDEAA